MSHIGLLIYGNTHVQHDDYHSRGLHTHVTLSKLHSRLSGLSVYVCVGVCVSISRIAQTVMNGIK